MMQHNGKTELLGEQSCFTEFEWEEQKKEDSKKPCRKHINEFAILASLCLKSNSFGGTTQCSKLTFHD
jgi:hypothetical protein